MTRAPRPPPNAKAAAMASARVPPGKSGALDGWGVSRAPSPADPTTASTRARTRARAGARAAVIVEVRRTSDLASTSSQGDPSLLMAHLEGVADDGLRPRTPCARDGDASTR